MKVEREHGLIGRVTVPFDAPDVYVRPHFGCPVVRGDQFTVLLCSGTTLVNPTL